MIAVVPGVTQGVLVLRNKDVFTRAILVSNNKCARLSSEMLVDQSACCFVVPLLFCGTDKK